MTKPVVLAGHIDVAPEARAGLLEQLAPLIEATRAEPGCVEFCLAADPAVPGRLVLIEIFESVEVLKEHQGLGNQAAVTALIMAASPTGSSVLKYRVDAVAPMIGPDGTPSLDFP